MKKLFIILLIILMTFTVVVAKTNTTYHWQLENTDDAYVLCANGHFTVEVNGHDSIHLICEGGETKDE